MSCEICGQGNCTRSFHTLEAQEEFDQIADSVKERCRRLVLGEINSIDGYYTESGQYIIDLSTVLTTIKEMDL